MKEIISTELAPGAIGPYSQGIKAGSIIFTSGQLPVNPATGELETKDIRRAAELSMKNVEAILKAKGASLNNVVKTTIFLKDISMFGDVNEVYGTFFKEEAPARSCVQVAKLPKDALIEIEAIAYL